MISKLLQGVTESEACIYCVAYASKFHSDYIIVKSEEEYNLVEKTLAKLNIPTPKVVLYRDYANNYTESEKVFSAFNITGLSKSLILQAQNVILSVDYE